MTSMNSAFVSGFAVSRSQRGPELMLIVGRSVDRRTIPASSSEVSGEVATTSSAGSSAGSSPGAGVSSKRLSIEMPSSLTTL